jgi:hypothetical protein
MKTISNYIEDHPEVFKEFVEIQNLEHEIQEKQKHLNILKDFSRKRREDYLRQIRL